MNTIYIVDVHGKVVTVVVDDEDLMAFLKLIDSSVAVDHYIVNDEGSGKDIDPENKLTKLK